MRLFADYVGGRPVSECELELEQELPELKAQRDIDGELDSEVDLI